MTDETWQLGVSKQLGVITNEIKNLGRRLDNLEARHASNRKLTYTLIMTIIGAVASLITAHIVI